MSLVIKEWMAMRQQTGWPMKEPWKLHKGNHGSTEVTIPCSCTVTNSKSRYPVLSASSHIMFYEFHALWDWANYEPSICNLWSETCIVGLSILWTLNMWSLIRNMLVGLRRLWTSNMWFLGRNMMLQMIWVTCRIFWFLFGKSILNKCLRNHIQWFLWGFFHCSLPLLYKKHYILYHKTPKVQYTGT